ncbi:hypothetical protein BC629DRAFT_1437518 [Irpex lacteus]|nr:hypothetical protein BC629DRAFT_1437518 [Irpex lacteus]
MSYVAGSRNWTFQGHALVFECSGRLLRSVSGWGRNMRLKAAGYGIWVSGTHVTSAEDDSEAIPGKWDSLRLFPSPEYLLIYSPLGSSGTGIPLVSRVQIPLRKPRTSHIVFISRKMVVLVTRFKARIGGVVPITICFVSVVAWRWVLVSEDTIRLMPCVGTFAIGASPSVVLRWPVRWRVITPRNAIAPSAEAEDDADDKALRSRSGACLRPTSAFIRLHYVLTVRLLQSTTGSSQVSLPAGPEMY